MIIFRNPQRDNLLKKAMILSIITIGYNVIEGGVSTLFGYSDETIALFGFGVDSFVEVISGAGILHMVLRMRQTSFEEHDRFERRALYVTAIAFFILAAGLAVGGALSIYSGAKPETTIPGIIVASISIAAMWFLYRSKLKTGMALDSAPIVADAGCTKTCFYLSFVLLASSLLWEFFTLPYVDAAGGFGIAWFAFREGRESLEKARTGNLTCSCGGECH